MTVRFLLVHQVMLGGRLDALNLDTVGDGWCQYCAEKRIFAAHVLSRPTVERRAVQVDGRRQHLLTACDAGFVADGQTEFLGPVNAPGGREC